jgi:hypothetical protein
MLLAAGSYERALGLFDSYEASGEASGKVLSKELISTLRIFCQENLAGGKEASSEQPLPPNSTS